MDVVERIKSQLATQPVVLFMKGTPDFPQCGFSAQTVAALRAVGAQFHAVNIFEDPELRDALKRYSNWPTYPAALRQRRADRRLRHRARDVPERRAQGLLAERHGAAGLTGHRMPPAGRR